MLAPAPGLRLRVPALDFGGEPVFRGLEADFAGGRCSCLLGPSGSGKTTLLRLLAGLLPGQGDAAADDGAPLRGRVAYMAQSDLLLPWLTVLENAVLGWRLRGARSPELARARERARGLLAAVGLGDRAGARPAELSGGMRQRAALARTLMEARPVVLMDEPFASLDALTRLRLQDLASRLLAGRTVLLVTHDPLEAVRLGHDLFVLSGAPASLRGPLRPAGEPPRPAGDPAALALQARLLEALAGDAAEGAFPA